MDDERCFECGGKIITPADEDQPSYCLNCDDE